MANEIDVIAGMSSGVGPNTAVNLARRGVTLIDLRSPYQTAAESIG